MPSSSITRTEAIFARTSLCFVIKYAFSIHVLDDTLWLLGQLRYFPMYPGRMLSRTYHDHDTRGVLGISAITIFRDTELDCVSAILHSMGSRDPDDPSPSIMYENNAGLRKNIWFKCQVTISEGNFVALDSWVLERHTGKTHKIWPYVAGDTTDRSDWRNSFSVSPTAIANFADRSDWRIKSASISSMPDTSEFRLRISQTIKFAVVGV